MQELFLEFIIEYEVKYVSMEEKRLNYLNEYTRLIDTQEYFHISSILLHYELESTRYAGAV